MALDDLEVLDTDDGGAIVDLFPDEGGGDEMPDLSFYENIIDQIEKSGDIDLETMISKLMDDIKRDKESREKRDEEYAVAIKRTGLGKEAPGGADFEGSNKTVHPMMLEASVDFASRAIKELMPANGPVNSFVPGERPTSDRLEKADRKKEYMNWQFLVQMPDFRTEMEQLLTQLALGGSQYLRLIWDHNKKRPVPCFWPSDQVYLPYHASNFYTAERVTIAEPITRNEFEQRIKDGIYRDILPAPAGQLPEPSKAKEATDKVEGKDNAYDSYNQDGVRIIYEVQLLIDLDEKCGLAPYRILIDESSNKCVGIYRNWEENDDKLEPMFWMAEFPFVPWRGAYSIGLGQMIGSLSAAATGALRALLDSAQINNFPSLIKLKGANFSGQSKDLNVTQITELEGGIAGNDDVRKLIMAVPYNPPSAVLFQLLEFTVASGQGVVRTTFDKLGEQSTDMPVGTTLALIEEGMRVMSAIHLRLYHAMTYMLKILHRINRMYLTDGAQEDEVGDILAYREDFQLPMDIVPVADPEIFSDVQRLAQMQIVEQRAQAMPGIYDPRKVEERILERTKIPNYEELLVPLQTPTETNAVNENMAMTLGRPVAAFPEQEHLAHIQVHLDYFQSPMLGQSPLIAPTFIPMLMEHIKEHIAFWYVNAAFKMVQQSMQSNDEEMNEIMSDEDPEARREMDKLLGDISQELGEMAGSVFNGLPPIIQKAMELMEQYKPQPEIPIDPNKQMEIESKQQIEQMKIEYKTQEQTQQDTAKKELAFMELDSKERQTAITSAEQEAQQAQERVARLKELLLREAGLDERTASEIESRVLMNEQDNITALEIATAEIESGEKVRVESGTGINPSP